MNKEELNNKIAKGMMWRLFERGGVQVINFILQMILARILSPDYYGTIGLINIFITIATTLVNNGLCNAIINNNESDELDNNTVFYTQLIISVILVVTLHLLARTIALFFGVPEIEIYLKAMTVILLLESLTCMQLTVMRKQMDFKKSFYTNLTGVVVSAFVGIALAYGGFGCWALIFSQISQKVAVYISLKLRVKWEPKIMFSFSRLKKMFSYSWKLTVAWLFGTLHNQIFSLIVGKNYSKEILAYYDKAQNLPNTITVTANETISNVMFSALSKVNNNINEIKEYTKKTISLSSFIVFPIMAGIAGVSENFVMVFLTEKWAECIDMMKLFSVSYAINIISTTNMQSYNSIGRTDIFLKLEVVKRTITLLIVFIVARFSLFAIIYTIVAMGAFSLIYNMYYNNKLLGYKIAEQIKDLLKNMIPASIMFMIINPIATLQLSCMLELLIQIIVGISVYIICSIVMKNDIIYIFNLIRTMRKKNEE